MRSYFLAFTAILVFFLSTPPLQADGMQGMYGPAPMTREASGTSWQPDSTPFRGRMWMQRNGWMEMLDGFAYANLDHQGGPRGETQGYSNNMLMAMADGPWGPGTLGLRGMISLEPSLGPEGYALLLQTGESADGKTPLVDRQHPHDLLMEMAVTYNLTVAREGSVFAYLGYPGEPALGPTAFMHRFSGMDNPVAPLSHHWLDSTHITYGVATLGGTWRGLKLEASAFNGREPDEQRWSPDPPRLDSGSGRLSWNPSANWALQASGGHLHSPEALEEGVDQNRVTASALWARPLDDGHWQSTLAWGQNQFSDGRTSNAFLLESALSLHNTHTVFSRFERADKDELFALLGASEDAGVAVNAASLGYVYDFPTWQHLKPGLGAMGTVAFLPDTLISDYGNAHPVSYLLFLRVRID